MILITGASGTVGRAVLEEVRKEHQAFTAMYRNAQDAQNAPAGTKTVIADFADAESLRKALAGVESVFLVCSPIPQLVELESNVIDACQEIGVRHVVLNSALGAGKYDKSFPSWHAKVEEKLTSTQLSHTILRPNGFMQNILAYDAPTVRTQNAIYEAMGDAKVSLIDVRDIAVVAAKALLFPGEHARQTYELNGPEAVSYTEIASRISRVIGHEVTYVDTPEASLRKAMMDAGTPEWLVTAILELQAYYRSGACAEVNDALRNLLGREPRKLDAFLEENKDAFRGQAAGA